MKAIILTIAATAIALVAANADKESKEVTVTGEVKCLHCDLKVKTSCQNGIQTTDKKIYSLEGKIAEKFFDDNEDVEKITATGTATEAEDHTVLDTTKIEEAKS